MGGNEAPGRFRFYGGTLIAAPVDRVLEHSVIFLNTNRLPKREPQRSRYAPVPDVAHTLAKAIQFLAPLFANMATRYLLLETTNPSWMLLLHNHGKVRGDLALTAHLTEVMRTRSVGWLCEEHTLKRRGGELIGRPGGASINTHADGRLVRSIDCVYEGRTWRFAEFGTPYDFERVERYADPRKKERLTCEIVKEYLRAFGLSPWKDDFYRVNADHPAKGIQFTSDDPAMNSWLEPMAPDH